MTTESTSPPPTVDLRAARYELVSRLADDLAHEIKNPLHAMVINLEVLRRRIASGDGAAAGERADVIEHELHRVNELVEHILLLLRPDRSAERGVPLDAALGEVVPLIAVRANAARKAFRFDPDADGCVVPASAEAVKLALLAVAEWATDAVPGDGDGIVVSTGRTHGRAVVRLRAHGADAPVPGAAGASPLADPVGLARALLADFDGEVHATPTGDRGYCEVSLTLACSGGA